MCFESPYLQGTRVRRKRPGVWRLWCRFWPTCPYPLPREKAVWTRRDWKEIVTPPGSPQVALVTQNQDGGFSRAEKNHTLSPMRSNNLRIIDGFSFALLFDQFNEVLIMPPSVCIQITRHNFVTNHHTRNNKSGTVFTVARETVLTKICWVNIGHVCSYFGSRNTLKTLAKIEHASRISA